ncbi:shikimate dehydrogenase family protein [Jiella pelagia]|uniref:shikimate dehydrogenase (NADP(+)) n=1 Tax=Jiella pelagia TaxID=2986949 RepID=A0ABY7BVV3_9HYPH|nr:NAD(P)-dependent oxidoreductase [Jiella pelagia]WAP66775.1 shikimate dehydrogenase [Jiella pelagia]
MTIDGTTSVLVHLAYPAAHLKTPQLFNPRCEERGLNAVLVPWQVAPAHLAEMMDALRQAESVAGAIVTIPHKETSAALCDRLEGVAAILKVANVIKRHRDGSLVGRILDGEGFVGGLRRSGIDPAGSKVLIVGAGGVALAIAAALVEAGAARIEVCNRTRQRAEDMIERLSRLALERDIAPELGIADEPSAAGFDLVINATSLGMHAGDPLPVQTETIGPGMTVAEVIMAPAVTPLLEAAAERGATVVPGREMLLGQIDPFIDFLLGDAA